jgi:hypothetical protein
MSGALRHLLTRRRLLKLGLGLGGAAIVAGGGATAWLLSDRPAAAGRAALSEREAAVVAALADAYFPPGSPLGVSVEDVDVVSGADAYIAGLLAKERRLLRALLTAIDQWPRVTLSSPARFSAWPRSDRVKALRALDESPVPEKRQLAGLLRALVAMPFFDDPRVLQAVGFSWGCGF